MITKSLIRYRYIAGTIISLSILLLIYMVTIESEPGAMPLILLITGTIWFFMNERTIKKNKP